MAAKCKCVGSYAMHMRSKQDQTRGSKDRCDPKLHVHPCACIDMHVCMIHTCSYTYTYMCMYVMYMHPCVHMHLHAQSNRQPEDLGNPRASAISTTQEPQQPEDLCTPRTFAIVLRRSASNTVCIHLHAATSIDIHACAYAFTHTSIPKSMCMCAYTYIYMTKKRQ